MQSDLSLSNLTCPTHINELIIRVSLQDKEKQLFYCYECIKGKEKPGLVKLQDLLPELQKRYLEFSSKPPEKALPEEAEEFVARKAEIKMGIAEQVNEYKLKADEEINKMQKEMIKLLQTARSSIDQKLDGYEDSFNNTFNDYNNLIKAYEELLANSDKPLPSQDELSKRIFSTSSSEEAEINLKNVLGEIKARSELKEGVMLRKIEKTKNILETCKEAMFRIPEKNLEEYESKLKPLQTYLEALVCQSKEEIQTNDEKQKGLTKQEEISKNLYKAFEKLNKVLETSNSQIKKILEEKFNVKSSNQQCTLSESGLKPVKGRSYKCYTCIEKYRDIKEDEFVCEACKDNCHQGHRFELAGTGNNEFVCQCQLTLRECKLATTCTIKYTGENYIRQTYFSCRTDGMGTNQCICSFCAINCHKGHTVSYKNTGTAYCDCSNLFPFCKHNQ